MSASTDEPAALEALRSNFRGTLLSAEHEEYDLARRVFNGMIDRRPALIALCTGVADILEALRFAREEGLAVAVRGGGHGVSGDSVVDDGIVIDLSPMKGIQIDPEERVVRVQAGVRWGELDRETQAFGLAVTGGRMSGTGVAGLTLGGGSGWIERQCGLSSDNLISADVVLADGRFVRVSEELHPDLFWGLKGGGGNFGIVTSFEFRLHPVGPVMLGGMMLFPGERSEEVLRAYGSFMADAPDGLGGACGLLTAPPEEFVPEEIRGAPVVSIVVSYVGPTEEGEEVIAPLRALGPALDLVQPMPYTVLQQLIDPGNPSGMQNYWKAGYLEELSEEAIATLVSHAREAHSPLTAVLVIPMGGALARHEPSSSPQGLQRDSSWNYHILSLWPDPSDSEREIAWTRALAAAMEPLSRDGVYLNFASETAADSIRTAFGPDNYKRLVAVKDLYDPDDVFSPSQRIASSGESARVAVAEAEEGRGGG